MSGIGIITNPHSKLNKRNPNRKDLLAYILGDKGQLEATKSLDDITRVAENFKKNGVEILAINGGDGTISHTLTAFKKVYQNDPLPQIALLRGGTMNVLASSLGIKGSPEKILYRLVEYYSRSNLPESKDQLSIRVNGQTGFLFATGIAPNVLKEYYKNKSGDLKAIFLVAKLWFSGLLRLSYYNQIISSHEDNINLGKNTYKKLDNLSVFCSTVEKLPLGFRFFKSLRHNTHSKFEAVIINCSPEKLLWKIPRVVFSKLSGLEVGKFCHLTPNLTLQRPGAISYTLDGELFTAQESLKVEIGDKFSFVNLSL